MGLLINADLETSAGSTKEAYARIDNYRVDKVSSRIRFAVSYWLSEEYAHKFNRKYLDQKLKNATGLFSNLVVIYDEEDNGEEIEFPTFLEVNISKEEETKVPIYESKNITEEVPYVSFDENGDEVTKYRTVEKTVKEVVSYEVEIKEVIDNSIIGDLTNFCYNKLTKEIQKVIPSVEIKNI